MEDHGSNIQNQDLVDDQLTQVLNNLGTPPAPTDDAATAPTDEPAATAPADEPVADPAIQSFPAPTPTPDSKPAGAPDDDLLQVKQDALVQLTPLVDHLELTPEERFDTYMMIIRASDDKGLVKPAFAAAQAIADENKKAHALLDVINEITYLTQPTA